MFKICEYCGANLDPGERCDCDRTHERNRKLFSSLVDTDGYQYKIKMEITERNDNDGIYV